MCDHKQSRTLANTCPHIRLSDPQSIAKLNFPPTKFSSLDSMKALTVHVVLCTFFAKVCGYVPPAPWLNDKDCASALNSMAANNLRVHQMPLNSRLRPHCMQGVRAAMFLSTANMHYLSITIRMFCLLFFLRLSCLPLSVIPSKSQYLMRRALSE